MQNQYDSFNYCVACNKRITYNSNGYANHKCDEKWENRRHNIRKSADNHKYIPCIALKIEEGLKLMQEEGMFG